MHFHIGRNERVKIFIKITDLHKSGSLNIGCPNRSSARIIGPPSVIQAEVIARKPTSKLEIPRCGKPTLLCQSKMFTNTKCGRKYFIVGKKGGSLLIIPLKSREQLAVTLLSPHGAGECAG